MKRALLGTTLILTALGALAQGTVTFNNRVTGTIVTRVYATSPLMEWYRYGNTATDTPAGTQIYLGSPLQGNGWTAQLWAAPGADRPESALQPAFPTTTFRTSATAAGQVNATTATLTGVPKDAPVATLQMRVWKGTYSTWEEAWRDGPLHNTVGQSPLFNVYNIGGDVNTPPNLIGLQSFTLYGMPEPSSAALLGLGMLALLLRRRRKA